MSLSKYKIAIIGLGYVGLPLAVAFSKKYNVFGFDVNSERVTELKNGYDRTQEIAPDKISDTSNLSFSDQPESIKHCNVFIVTENKTRITVGNF